MPTIEEQITEIESTTALGRAAIDALRNQRAVELPEDQQVSPGRDAMGRDLPKPSYSQADKNAAAQASSDAIAAYKAAVAAAQ